MVNHREMVDTGTGASRPCSPTREMACSPIKFNSSIETSTSDGLDEALTTIQQSKNKTDVNMKKKYVLTNYLLNIFTNFKN